jgi:hypothetical protein
MTLNAVNVFPTSIVTSGGFIFPAGQVSITYNGITVTNQQGTRAYGGFGGRTETGNIGYAQVTFGDADGQLTTDVMPIFLYYAVTETATGLPANTQPQQGWFGVNAAPNSIEVAGSVAPAGGYPVCSQGVVGTCRVVSVFKYLQYGVGVNAGFMLNPGPLQQCDITTSGNCPAVRMLTVGLTESIEASFSKVTLGCPPSGYVGPEIIQRYLVCDSGIPDTTVTITGPATATLNEDALFDSGNPANSLYQASGALPSPLQTGSMVSVATPSGFTYTYEATASGVTETSVGSGISTGIGINFFTEHSFFIDFVTNTEGWT